VTYRPSDNKNKPNFTGGEIGLNLMSATMAHDSVFSTIQNCTIG